MQVLEGNWDFFIGLGTLLEECDQVPKLFRGTP
jgi:hypothetical protein